MDIRKRQPTDRQAVARLLEAAGLPDCGLERTEGWVVEENGALLGHVAVELTPEVAVIRSLAVSPETRGQGLARRLMETAEAAGGERILALRTESIGTWAERRGYVRTSVDRLPASVRATTQFEGALCSGTTVYARAAAGAPVFLDPAGIKSAVRERYGALASAGGSCCPGGSGCGCGEAGLAAGYRLEDLAAAPEGSNLGLGCGNPVAFASLREGEVVLDLGSGAGFDAFLASQRVGAAGRVIGVDITPGMLDKARDLAARHGFGNVEFRRGDIEDLPVSGGSVDVVISNCVINLAVDKARVFREAFRVLKPGGRLMVADLVLLGPLPESMRQDMDAYAACLAGALPREDYLAAIQAAGFSGIEVVGESSYEPGPPDSGQPEAAPSVSSLQVSAWKPREAGPGTRASCCGSR